MDKANGKGIIIYNNGDKYEGDFRDNFLEGKGIYNYKTIKYMDNDIKTEIEKILMNKLPEMTKKERTKSKKFITIMKSNKFEIKHHSS